MSINACMAQDIIELNNKKEYTATATVLLEMVLTDTNLSAHAAKLWQILFSKARFHADLEITILISNACKNIGQIL